MARITNPPDFTSVRSLITSVFELARHLKMPPISIYRWINVNRVPGEYLIKIANFYGVEITQLLPLTGSDKNNEITVKLKPRSVLKTLMDVFQGMITIEQAVEITGSSKISLTLIMAHWGDKLPTLYTTLEQLDQKRIDLAEASHRLGVAKNTLYGIRRKYGYAPGAIISTKPKKESTLLARHSLNKGLALKCLAGKTTVKEAAREAGVSERTLFRTVDSLTPYKIIEISMWPVSFREALVEEIKVGAPYLISKWVEFAKSQRLFIGKPIKYTPTSLSYTERPLKNLIVNAMLSETTLDEISVCRRTNNKILHTLFTSDLKPLGITYKQIEHLKIAHKAALKELILTLLYRNQQRKRTSI